MLRAGCDLRNARSALILLHGRGAGADDMLALAQVFTLPADMSILAPQANGYVWYPQRFIAPLSHNEPYLSSALQRVSEVVNLAMEHGLPPERILLGGFSQGACLAAEYVIRSERRWGGLFVFSGGFIGEMGIPRTTNSSLENSLGHMPVFVGCSDIDPHIPLSRVEETALLLESMGAVVTKRIYPGMGHTINADEIKLTQQIILSL